MVIASIVVAVITLILALFIHSETRDIFNRVNLIMHTLPGAHDVKRVIEDTERSQEKRATLVCDAPKNTHLAFSIPAPNIPKYKMMIDGFWKHIGKLANYLSGTIVDESVIKESVGGKWEIKSNTIGSKELSELLEQGWEPFSVTTSNQVWVRRHRNPIE